jgi:protein SCO1
VPDFSYVDQTGARLSNRELAGHAWVADFIFTSCSSACPVLSARMVLLQRQVTAPGARFVSFSVDPEHDTPAVLAAYARKWHADPRWHLLATDARTLPSLTAAMKVRVQATGDATDPIMHSSRLLLVDGDGRVRGVYDSGDEAAMRRLAADLRRLSDAAPRAQVALASSATGSAPTGAAATVNAPTVGAAPVDGAHLFATLGCPGCHAAGQAARPLEGVYGSRVTLEDGRVVTADRAYLRESIVDPAAKLVAGYAPTMPSYAGLRGDELDALVGYVASLGRAATASAPPRGRRTATY